MINPLDNNEFKHFLNFKKPAFGLIQITEPVKFDAAEFIVEQGENYARDVSLMAEEIPLEFYRSEHEKANAPYELPNGVIVDRLGMALDLLLEADREFGFEAEVEYTLERNGVVFVPAELNFEKRETDESTYFNCSLVQNTKRALAKRRADIKIDGFATTDLDGNPTSPLETTNILLKAKPLFQQSKWRQLEQRSFFANVLAGGTSTIKYNYIQVNEQSGIDGTSGFIPTISVDPSVFIYIDALQDLTNVELRFNINAQLRKNAGDITSSTIRFRYFIGDTFSENFDSATDIAAGNLFSGSINNSTIFEINEEIILNSFNNAPISIPRGAKLWGYFIQECTAVGAGSSVFEIFSAEITINGTSTGIDTIVKAAPYISLIRKSIKDTNGFDLVTNDFDIGQKYGNLYAFSGNLIRQRDDVPFYFTLKDRIANLLFRNYDVQMNSENAFCLHYRDFYADVDNGGFVMPASEKFKSPNYNEKYAVNSLEYGFKTYEKDRDEENTLDAVHTQTQWLINNTKVTAVKKIDVEDIFDPFAIAVQQRLAIKETTALENDNKIFVIDTVPISPTARGGFSDRFQHQINVDEGTLKLLNNNVFAWNVVGVTVGIEFRITAGKNIGTYTVTEVENNLLTLSLVTGTLNYNGEAFTTISFPYTNVLLTNRTNEGFSLIENLESGDNFSNLAYTIRRNLVDWEEYMSTCAEFITQNISNTEFINNGELTTQLEGGVVYKENGDIVLSEIAPAILTPRLYETEVIVDYDRMLELINKYETLQGVGGFIRVQDTNKRIKKLYPKSLKYRWVSKVLTITGEERKESELVNITTSGGVITINRVGYPIDTLPEVFYEINGEYIVLFDINQVNLINFTKFDNVKVNGVIYDTVEGLAQAMSDL